MADKPLIPEHLQKKYEAEFVSLLPDDIRQRFEQADMPNSLELRALGQATGPALHALTDGNPSGDPTMRTVRFAALADPHPDIAPHWDRSTGLRGYVSILASQAGYRDPEEFSRQVIGGPLIQVEALEQGIFDEIQRALGLESPSLNFSRLSAADPIAAELMMPGISAGGGGE